jgi:hypothetical protein
MELFRTEKQLAKSGYLFRIVDNGGATFDRITVIFSDGDYLGLSQTGRGFSQWGDRIDLQGTAERVESGEEVDLAFGDLEPDLRRHIIGRVNEAWRDMLEAVAAFEESAVAVTREKAVENEGTWDCAGNGIYAAGEAYCVRLDGYNAHDDRGPFYTAGAALAATLPDEYSLAGPEYQSTVDVSSLKRTKGTAARLRALEKRLAQAA